jgi:uncharacterized LabA/DUF88 family protein
LTQEQRVVVYVDGFNLYFGMRDAGFRRYYWLNLRAMSENLLLPGQKLVATKYFTARIAGGQRSREKKRKRQADYLEALGTLPQVTLFEGQFLSKEMCCQSCGNKWRTNEEKMTDVQIATELLTDAFEGCFDTALVVSADSDLVPPIRAIRHRFPALRVLACMPPGRSSVELKKAANASLRISERVLQESQLPDEVQKPEGYVLKRPERWR